MPSLQLNTSYKHHIAVGLITGIWLVVFLVLIAPFDIAELPFEIRLQILPPYGAISLLGYLMVIPFQNGLLKKYAHWTIGLEAVVIVLFNLLVLAGSYAYYKSSIINGDYDFAKFTLQVYYPIFFVQLPVIIFARWFLNRTASKQELGKIVLTGENKFDILHIKESDLICISSADNYVEIAYLIHQVLHKKLLRTTLKKIHLQHPSLLKVHRSHLINPTHFMSWKDANTILLTQLEVPVSKNYKHEILALDHSPLKSKGLSQTP
ncbi:LytTR family transcriptional regulator DNA-binding domain-containing protein [Spongiimicrobium salis]|uniref:LytTR family transcriptional regulator DNA-binding domain-containing protein n=1 Tax=Spongiimicrobium salis TaxID=1667022 RepID=UPI00374DF38B